MPSFQDGITFRIKENGMRKDFGPKTWIYPQPVLIIGTYDGNGTPNAMNAAWGAIYDDDQVVLCLSRDHKTTRNIRESKAFTLAFATESTVIPCDYVGIVSGSSTADKVSKAGFTVTGSRFVDAPLINELPMAMECRLVRIDDEEHVIGEIVNVSADEAILGPDGRPDWRRLRPISYDPVGFGYIALGEKVGTAFREGKALIR